MIQETGYTLNISAWQQLTPVVPQCQVQPDTNQIMCSCYLSCCVLYCESHGDQWTTSVVSGLSCGPCRADMWTPGSPPQTSTNLWTRGLVSSLKQEWSFQLGHCEASQIFFFFYWQEVKLYTTGWKNKRHTPQHEQCTLCFSLFLTELCVVSKR